MTDLWLIGIGTGNPDHVTREAQNALRAAALILVPRKGPDKSDLAELRHQILAGAGTTARVAEFEMPVRDESMPYVTRVKAWHDQIARIWAETIADHRPTGPVALLVWGDPSLYDSTLRIADRLEPRPNLRVVPGITSLQALTAAHAIPLNTLNGAVLVSTGRRLRDHGWPPGAETVAIMLDGACSFQHLAQDEFDIWWGAFLGMENQIIDQGPLSEAGPRILDCRAKARAKHGWIMDSYLLRKRVG